ncbi:Cytochrome P450 [Actinacidiphila yanglinensis]|uniref:Cytochrome P450 n=1 Tax=Actinacidiphila yanglinensis TaxID=310779 RepID=A0A1H6A1Q4_9ACTN|nr:cytochrome P450 [Actinacidiphila yanglinensis]SEG42693.1 Cytochrome P450 [Actinacidiphila yanglinensis]
MTSPQERQQEQAQEQEREQEPEARRARTDAVVPPHGLAPERRMPQVGTAARTSLTEIPGPQPVPPWGPAAAQVQARGPAGETGPSGQSGQGTGVHAPGGRPAAPPAFDHADPGAYYRALRETYGPVAPVLLDGGMPAWLVLGYHEVHFVAGNPELFGRDPRRWHAWDRVPAGWPLLPHVAHTPSVRFTEGEEHLRRGGAVADVLAGVDPFELRQRAERAADAAVDTFAGAGRAELVAQYAEQVPLHVMAGLFGLRPDETAALERDLAGQYGYGTAAPGRTTDPLHPSRPAASAARLRDTLETVLARARRSPAPGADIPSRLLAHPAGLTDEEVVQDLLTIMAAGRRPTADWIGNTLRLMLTDERFALTLSGGRRSISQALAEVLWADPPVQNVIGRWATRDTQLGGRHIRRGDCLVLGLAAANADPQVCPVQPGSAVGNHAHLAFSHGAHRCPSPAPQLAEVVATTAVEILLDRLPDLTPTLQPSELPWRPSLWQRGPAALPVTFTPL